MQQSGSPDLGYRTERQLLTSIKLTRADMTVLVFHTVQCLWSGHVKGRHTSRIEEYTYAQKKGWGLGKGLCPWLTLTTRNIKNASLYLYKSSGFFLCNKRMNLVPFLNKRAVLDLQEHPDMPHTFSVHFIWLFMSQFK